MSGTEMDRGTWSLLILQTLKREKLHGYAIGARIRDRSDGRLDPEEGIIYPALRRIEKEGWIRGEWGKTDTGRKARFYSLTRKGHRALEEKTASWTEHAGAVFSVLDDSEVRG